MNCVLTSEFPNSGNIRKRSRHLSGLIFGANYGRLHCFFRDGVHSHSGSEDVGETAISFGGILGTPRSNFRDEAPSRGFMNDDQTLQKGQT